jgi:ferredoxin-NADP reductase
MATLGANSVSPVTDAQVTSASRKRLRWQNAVILAIESRTPRIRSFFLAPAQPFAYVAGQHVDVRLTAEDGYKAERSYSIASAPEAGAVIELAIEAYAGGEVSGYFHDVAAVGDTVEIRGPIGKHFVWAVADGPVLLIGGGSGLVPLMSMIRHRTLQRSSVSVGLILSATTWEDVLYRDELLALSEAGDGFELTLTLTREAAPREGVAARRVDPAMVRDMLARLPAAIGGVFICGSNPFVETAATAVTGLGVAASSVRTERYGE